MNHSLPNTPIGADMKMKDDLFRRFFRSGHKEFPISFDLDGQHIHGLPWPSSVSERAVDANIIAATYSCLDNQTGLKIEIEVILYRDFPVVEWTAWFANEGKEPSPLIENVKALDADFCGESPVLHHCKGEYSNLDGLEPFEVALVSGVQKQFSPISGRACDPEFPYYRIAFKEFGYTMAVGWPGQWEAVFEGGQNCARVVVGQQRVSIRLNPGERVRTPRMTFLCWTGDIQRSINLWRRWYLAHVLPRRHGKPLQPFVVGHGTDNLEEFSGATEANQLEFIQEFERRGITFDVWWIDAGWYPCKTRDGKRKWWETGTWKPDPDRFPSGFKPISDALHRQDAQLRVWFEPERARPGTELCEEHPGFLLSSDQSDDKLLNLGDVKARNWIKDRIQNLIQEGGIDVYRQDHNFPPLSMWRANDGPNRQGMTENLYIQGYLRFWDDLLLENPGLWIDSCANGGRRNDLETLRSSVPLHYTDYGYGDHAVKLAFQRTMFEWIPYFKEFTLSSDVGQPGRWNHCEDSFGFHCAMAPMLFPTFDIKRDDYDFDLIQKMICVWRSVANFVFTAITTLLPLTTEARRNGSLASSIGRKRAVDWCRPFACRNARTHC